VSKRRAGFPVPSSAVSVALHPHPKTTEHPRPAWATLHPISKTEKKRVGEQESGHIEATAVSLLFCVTREELGRASFHGQAENHHGIRMLETEVLS